MKRTLSNLTNIHEGDISQNSQKAYGSKEPLDPLIRFGHGDSCFVYYRRSSKIFLSYTNVYRILNGKHAMTDKLVRLRLSGKLLVTICKR